MKPEDLSPTQVLQVVALGLILLSLLAASIASWGVLIFRISKGLGFQTSSRPTASIGFIDCIIGFLVVAFCFTLAISTWRVFIKPVTMEVAATLPQIDNQSEQTEDLAPLESADIASDANKNTPQEKSTDSNKDQKSTITKEDVLGSGWVSIFQLMAAIITMVIVAGRIDWDWRGLGLGSTGVFRDIGIGMWVLLLMLPPISVINIATSLASGIEYNHPIIDAIKNYPWLVGIVAFQAVIVAPITEEFLFRGVLIGWFESAHFGRTANAILFGWKPHASTSETLAIEQPYDGGRDDKASPYSSPAPGGAIPSATSDRYSSPWWPAILSGVLFGLAHFSYGVSWVPLVIFGIILGRVYQLRQSLLMCIAVHMLFNGINILNLWLSLGLPTSK
jgi:membrane protease YdiL (CAAX protease family)